MYFLAIFTLAALLTDPPVVVKVFPDLDSCMTLAAEKNAPQHPFNQPSSTVVYKCLKLMPDA